VHTDYKTGADFSKYKTFTMMPLPKQGPPNDPGAPLRLAQPAKEAVASALTAKGLTEAPADQADLTVVLRGRSLPKVDITNYGYTYPMMTRYGTVPVVTNPYTTVDTYNERTLYVEMLDNRAKELVWVGSMTKDTSTKPVTPEMLQKAIKEVLAKYPPETKGSK
jgi:hypothetical protein